MADDIPQLLLRLAGEEAADQKQAADELGRLAYRLAHSSPADVPQLEPAVAPLTELLSSDSAALQVTAAWELTHLCKASPALATAVGGSGAAPALVQLLQASQDSNSQAVAAAALGAVMLAAEGRRAAKEAGAYTALVKCWRDSAHEQARQGAAEALVNGVLAGAHQAGSAAEIDSQEAQRNEAAREGAARIKELVDAGADGGAFLTVLFIRAIEQKGTDPARVGKLLYAAAELGALQGPGVEQAAIRTLGDTDDFSVGDALGGLVAGGALELAATAEHVRTARSDTEISDGFEEWEDSMLMGGGGAARVIGSLLRRLADEKGQQFANEAWQASGKRLTSFLPESDRNDAHELMRLVDQFGLGFVKEQR